MERRNHDRVAVNLKAALLDDQAMPAGCRIRDVSTGGMLFQHERAGTATGLREGDRVEVRLSLRQHDERKVIPLAMTVKHVEENVIGAEFVQPQLQLMKLVEPYRLDREDPHHAVEQQAQNTPTGSAVPAATSTRASRRRFAIQRARAQFAESMHNAHGPADAGNPTDTTQPPAGTTFPRKHERRFFYAGLLALIAALGLLLFDFSHRSALEQRMLALESVVDRQDSALTMLRARLAPVDHRGDELSSLNARVEGLSAAFAALETRLAKAAEPPRGTAPTERAATNSPATGATGSKVQADRPVVKTTLAARPAAPPADPVASWVINLASLYDQAAATRFAGKAQAQGIPADTRPVSVNQRKVWRVQVGGFSSREEALAYADRHKGKLGLNKVWVFRN
ncbi:MAG TPA: hypothetical protein ENK49_08640 [Gammaproteobacteria bacterium]|nr:hypothetical protein [Gammaproteobacteria bacterium]